MSNNSNNQKLISENSNSTEEIHFYNLSANEINKDSIYLKALDYAIRDKNVFNIAITGKYGAGKTSTIKTYENLHLEYQYLNISLASFKDNGQDNNTSIERSILQQLFYSIDSKKIPFSRFKKIKSISVKEICYKCLIFLLIIVSLFLSIYLLKNPQFINFEVFKGNAKNIITNYFSTFKQGLSVIILCLLFLTSSIFCLYYLFKKIILLLELSNIKFKNENIEVHVTPNEVNVDSIFNKYLDEIIYFFEETNYDIVVIEDLDRFQKSNEVFIKLRELNKLINNCETINKKIKFIYCIKDEIFANKERTKFFDFIIPIIPVINFSNSRQKLLDKLEDNSIKSIVGNQFVRNITLYIDDMRILNNIINEFNIYRKNLEIENLTMENLFSVIVYKNMYPKEFAELQEGKGAICNIFNTKAERINKYCKQLKEEKNKYQEEIKNIENANHYSEKLIKQILWAQIKEALGLSLSYSTDLIINRVNVTYEQFISPNNKLEDIINCKIRKSSSVYYDTTYTFKEIQNNIPQKNRISIENYIENKDKEHNEIEILENKIYDIDNKLIDLNNTINTKLSYLISKYGIENILSETERKNDLLTFLLINGYIDENYEEYINYFYPGALKTSDKSFLISIQSQNGLGYEYPLNEIKEIIEELPNKCYSQKEILNFNLLNYMLKNYNKYKEEITLIFQQLKDASDSSINFSTSFLRQNQELEIFVKELCKNWPNIWKYINANADEDTKKLYIYNIFKYVPMNNLEKINNIEPISNYLSLNNNFIFDLEEKYIDKTKKIISTLDIKFESINTNNIDTKIGDFIITNNFYKINKSMIYAILEKKYNCKLEEIESKNYSSILKTNDSNFIQYINDNIVEYIEHTYLLGKESLEDDIIDIINILNNENVLPEHKQKIIKRQKMKIDNIENINNDLWKMLLEEEKITVNWNNIICYYVENGLSKELVSFMNANKELLITSKIVNNHTYDNDVYNQFCQDIILQEEINEELLICINYKLSDEIFNNDVNSIRIAKIINENSLIIDEAVYESIQANYNNLLIVFIEKNINFFIENMATLTYNETEIESLLTSDNIEYSNKVLIINNLDDISCTNENAAVKYTELILSSNTEIVLSIQLLKSIINLLPSEKGLELLINQAENLDEEQFLSMLDNFSSPYNALRGTQIPKFEKNKINEKFIEIIRHKRISNISSISSKKPNFYYIYKKRK